MGNLVTAVTSGDTRATLVALRDRLAEEIEQASGRDLPALSRQFTEVLRLLNELPSGTVKSAADEIAERREKRRAAANEG